MRRRFAALGFAVLAFLSFGRMAHAAAGPAPADAVFGRFKMTPLQIRLKLDMLARAYHARWTSDHDILHDATLAEDALHAWASEYPDDSWLAPTAFRLAQLYGAVQTSEARAQALTAYRYVASRWPASSYGRTSRLRIAHGFPRLDAESAVRPTPNPYARAAPARSTPAAAQPVRHTPVRSPQPQTTPKPQATPTPQSPP